MVELNMMCGSGAGFSPFMTGTILPLVAYATFITAMLIAISFMLGRALSNPKLTLWSKTELVQLFVSAATVLFIPLVVSTFCSVDMGEVGGIFDITDGSGNIYDSAQRYLADTAVYAHNAVTVVRYHLEGYTVISYFNALMCEGQIGGGIGIGCFFGQGSDSIQPLGGYGATMGALNVAFNSSIMSYFSAMNFLFILLFVYRGFVFLFLPLGVFLRSMPYMRPFGSLMFAMALSFLIVYPLMLAIFGLMHGALLIAPQNAAGHPMDVASYNEKIFPESETGSELGGSTGGAEYVRALYFSGNDEVVGAISWAATAFIAGIFFPTLAMLATLASVSYVARLYGDEIDLSKLTQMV
ncbi:hypothetical protein H0O00_03355 [Candidatus Micrarchaeota archaeon]|nr:hypothetical protein [Candidatus Micrarchaeota archaeon]